ncbi:ankyrin repeat-containing domain protein, partial [Baffinella frigidus]
DAEGNRPLHLACRGAHTEVVRCLLSRKVDCNALDARGRSGLHLCALSDAGGAAHAIVSGGGANKELKDADGRTAESIAADLGH